MVMQLSFGYSPCPNDTYMFASIANGDAVFYDYSIKPVIRDVETLNYMALDEILDISKLSFYAYFKAKKTYKLLLSCGTMGFNCGPILISKKKLLESEISNCRIVLPGNLTTAHLLFRLWKPDADKRIFTTYDKIFDFINRDQADCGVIIHESRFTFEEYGFRFLVDLGAWWRENTGMPVPLGCIAAKRSIGDNGLRDIDNMLKLSLKKAESNPSGAMTYIKKFSQELSDSILLHHIHMFVNEFSLGFSDIGLKAIDELYSRAFEMGIIK